MIDNSADLLIALDRLKLIDDDRYPHWWRSYGSWWIIVEAILTQQTKWENVEKSVENLKNLGVKSLKSLLDADVQKVALAITPAGFYNQKTARILQLAARMQKDFGGFEQFCENAQREWLLECTGIGFETADSILCYGCKKAVMTADNYSAKLLAALGFETDEYSAVQEWLIAGVQAERKRIAEILPLEDAELYAYFHGLIVEFCKGQKRGQIDITPLVQKA
ncbi:3-methyladenine DNA glycosylase [Campylobacterota bacterium]|nr:3-methyladenine DNA glycosylase [Campylobacterota bacterium]